MVNIPRNAHCPCGSGKKYKRCHGKEGSPPMPEQIRMRPNFEGLLSTTAPLFILKFLGGIQLLPSNHGKNVQFEEMARLALLAERKKRGNRDNAYWEELKTAIEGYNDRIWLQDEPTNLFSENIVFAEGNYIVYPGIYVSGSRILNELLESIFLVRNELPAEFTKKISEASGLMLDLSNSAAKYLQHTRHLYVQQTVPSIELPDFDAAQSYLAAITFPEKYISSFCERRNFDPAIINEFVIDINDPLLDNNDPSENRTLRKPIVRVDSDFILYMPTCVVPALIDFIYEKAHEHNCLIELKELFQDRQFNKAFIAIKKMGWVRVEPELPENKSHLPIKEAVFRFDNDKLGYLCFIGKDYTGSENNRLTTDKYDQRNREVIDYLVNTFTGQIGKVLSVFTLTESGDEFFFMWTTNPDPHQSIALSISELETIAYDEKANFLTLWKFAKTFRETNKIFRIESHGGTLDAFFSYEQGQGSFYNPHKKNPIGGSLYIPVGVSNPYRMASQVERDEHAVPIFYKKQLAYNKVVRYKKYAPIYKEKEPIEADAGRVFRLVIESYKMPIWVINRYSAESGSSDFAKSISEGIAFWLHKMREDIKPVLDSLNFIQFEIEAVVDERLQRKVEFKEEELNSIEANLGFEIQPPTIQIYIPYGFLVLVRRADNYADKLLMLTVIEGLVAYVKEAKDRILITKQGIQEMVEKHLQPDNAKMFLFSDTFWKPKLDNRNLLPSFYISNTDISFILDHLVSFLPKDYVITTVIEEPEKKLDLCKKVVAALVGRIQTKLEGYEGPTLLAWLIRMNERVINTREFDQLLVPARIACFSSVERETKELHENDQRRIETGQALRTMIEFAAAVSPTGSKVPNFDDIGEMLALADQLITWGSISDSIWKKLDDPKMGLLPSGRIGIGEHIQNTVLQPFSLSRVSIDIYNYIKNWQTNFENQSPEGKPNTHVLFSEKFDFAYQKEYGIKLSRLNIFLQLLVNYGISKGLSCTVIEQSKLRELIGENIEKVQTKEIDSFLELLTLKKRKNIGARQPDFPLEEIYPWRHKRKLSYLNRPLASINIDNQIFYYYGFRHLLDYRENLYYQLEKGRVTVNTKELKSLMGQISNGKGNPFRQVAMEWFQANSDFAVIPYEVDIKPKGPLIAPKHLGDIDLLVVDHKQKLIYPIECKNISSAKTMYEMWSEIVAYLGDDKNDEDAKIIKHLNRHNWLQENKATLNKFLGISEDYLIKSFVLTPDEIPLTYLKKHTLPLPVVALTLLERDGITRLKNL
jgi:hypothetical protein